MSYEPHTWVDREIISDQKMNHIENGIYDEETRATNAETLLGTGISDEEARARNAEALLAPQATTYTKTEVDNMVSALSSGLDWKESVATYADIATTYPNPEDGWTVNVQDTDITYRYDGTAWVAISANAIPKATSALDGLMAKEDYSLLHGLSPEKIGFGYGTCSTASGTTAKTVSVTDFVLKENGMVVVAFTNAVEAGATLNVNSTGAKAIYYRGVALVANVISAGDTVTFVYDGTYYHVTAIDIGGSGGSGGHTILDRSQTAMTQRDDMWFKDAKVSDDSTNDSTNIEMIQVVTKSQFDNLPTDGSADGVYVFGDGQGGSGIDADDVTFDNTGTTMQSTNTGDAIRELNADLVLDYSQSSLPASTDINTFLQMMLERFYPNHLWDAINNNYQVINGGLAYTHTDKITISGSNLGGSKYVAFQTVSISGTIHAKVKLNSVSGGTFRLHYSNSSDGTTGNETISEKSSAGEYEITGVVPANKYIVIGFSYGSGNGSIDAEITELYID